MSDPLDRLTAIALELPEAKREESVDWDEVIGLVVESFRLCAPKSLARSIA